jgi:hypothetical protein
MATTNANDQSNTPLLKDLKGLKGFVDVHWAVPKAKVRQALDEKAGEEGLIDVLAWRKCGRICLQTPKSSAQRIRAAHKACDRDELNVWTA